MNTAPIVPYVAPLFLFMLCLSAESYVPDQHFLTYPLKTLLVALVLAWYWRELPSLRPVAPLISMVVGAIGIVLWVGLAPLAAQINAFSEHLYNQAVSAFGFTSWRVQVDNGLPAGRNPFQIYSPGLAWLLFSLRLLGISLCVPIMEELFWRGFLMRWIIKEDFTTVPLGTYQPLSFWITTACFASVHGSEWPLAVVVGIIYGFWFVWTKSLGSIMVAHGVTNFFLALYCLYSNDWHFLSSVAPAASPK